MPILPPSISKKKNSDTKSVSSRPKAIYSEAGDLMNKTTLLASITEDSTKLVASLSATWEKIEERLWSRILEILVNLATASSGTESVAPALTSSSILWDNICYRHHSSVCQVGLPRLFNVLYALNCLGSFFLYFCPHFRAFISVVFRLSSYIVNDYVQAAATV